MLYKIHSLSDPHGRLIGCLALSLVHPPTLHVLVTATSYSALVIARMSVFMVIFFILNIHIESTAEFAHCVVVSEATLVESAPPKILVVPYVKSNSIT